MFSFEGKIKSLMDLWMGHGQTERQFKHLRLLSVAFFAREGNEFVSRNG